MITITNKGQLTDHNPLACEKWQNFSLKTKKAVQSLPMH